jgi:hypothetical protein
MVPAMMSVLRGKETIGFVIQCAKGWKAFTVSGQPIGYFGDNTAAAKAVYQHADAARNHQSAAPHQSA